jgi:hypothetical protein
VADVCAETPAVTTNRNFAIVYAVALLRGRDDADHRLGFTVPFVAASVAAAAQPVIEHILGMRFHDTKAQQACALRARNDHAESGFSEAQWCAARWRSALDTVPWSDRPPVNITTRRFNPWWSSAPCSRLSTPNL